MSQKPHFLSTPLNNFLNKCLFPGSEFPQGLSELTSQYRKALVAILLKRLHFSQKTRFTCSDVHYKWFKYQPSFAVISESYSERNFNIKCCIALAGTTDIGKLNFSNCAGFDKSEIKRVSSLSISDTLTVRGGRSDTASPPADYQLHCRTNSKVHKRS